MGDISHFSGTANILEIKILKNPDLRKHINDSYIIINGVTRELVKVSYTTSYWTQSEIEATQWLHSRALAITFATTQTGVKVNARVFPETLTLWNLMFGDRIRGT